MKKVRFSVITIGLTLFSIPILSQRVMAAEIETVKSKIVGEVTKGLSSIEVKDVNLGDMSIGKSINQVKNEKGIKITDHSGGQGWQATVLDSAHERNKRTLELSINGKNISNFAVAIASGDTKVSPTEIDMTVDALWGEYPSLGDYSSDLTWTLTPNLPEAQMKWGTADVDVFSNGVAYVKNGVIGKSSDLGEYKEVINKVVIKSGVSYPKDEIGTFTQMKNLREIVNFEDIDDSKTTYHKDTFAQTQNLLEVDLTTWDMSNVTEVSGLFRAATVGKIDVSNWNTPNLTRIDGLFYNTTTSVIDLSTWSTPKVYSISALFNDVKADKIIIGNWAPEGVTSARSLFADVDLNKTPIDTSHWKLNKLDDIDSLFRRADGIEKSGFENWTPESIKDATSAFSGSTSNREVNIKHWNFAEVEKLDDVLSSTDYDLSLLGVPNWATAGELITATGAFNSTNYQSTLNLNKWNVSNLKDATSIVNSANIDYIEWSDWRLPPGYPMPHSSLESYKRAILAYAPDHSDTSKWW